MRKSFIKLFIVLFAICIVLGNHTEVLAAKKAQKVTLNHSEYTLKKGKSVKLKATVTPKNAKNKKVTFSSSNQKVATVDSKGKVKAKKNGTTKITAKVKGTKLKATCKIMVGQPVSKVSVSPKAVTLTEGESAKLKTTISPKKASNKKVTYISSDESVATVNTKGQITANKAGTAKITVTAKDGSKKKAVVAVTVNAKSESLPPPQPKPVPTVAVTGISLDKTTISLDLKTAKTAQLTATITPKNATNKKITYTVTNGQGVVSVSETGLVTAIAVGTAEIKAVTEDGKKEAVCQVEVTGAIDALLLDTESGARVIEAGTTDKVVVSVYPIATKVKKVTYESLNPDCATIAEDGTITAIQNGHFTVVVTVEDHKGNKASEELELSVGTSVTDVELGFDEASMYVGEEKQLEATVLPTAANNKQLTYESSDETIVSVSETGLMKALANGEADITVKTVDGGKTKICHVTVTEVSNVENVTNQEQLEAALASEDVQMIHIQTEEAVTLTIPEGTYDETSLVIDAAQAHIENEGTFRNIKIEAIGPNSFVEKAFGNSIYFGANTGTVKVEEGAQTSIYAVEGAGALNLVNHGQVNGVTLNVKVDLTVSGDSNNTIQIKATVNAENSSVTTDKKLNITANSKISLEILSGAEETEVTTDTKDNIPMIQGLGRIRITIEMTSDIEFIVGTNNGEDTNLPKLLVTGAVVDSSNNPMEDAALYLIPYSMEITEENADAYLENAKYTALTDAQGIYAMNEVAIGNYLMVVKKDGFRNAVETFVLRNEGSDTYTAELVMMIEEGAEGTGNLSGTLIDAQSGIPVTEGFTVRIRKGKNNVSGEFLAETYTDEEGRYSFTNLEAGQYTVQVLDYRDNPDAVYITTQFSAVVLADTDNVKNSTITAVLSEDQVRFVLRWGDEESGASSDLDSHMVGPEHNGIGEFHTWYSDQTYYADGEDGLSIRCADLDVDDVTWEGPETSTIYVRETGEYRFYVHDYSNGGSTTSDQMGKSAATVEVYAGSRLKTVYNVPNEPGTLWYVCKYNVLDDELTAVNTMSFWEDSEAEIGLDPVKLRKAEIQKFIEQANTVLALLTKEEGRTELESAIETARNVMDTSEDIEELKTARDTLKALLSEYEGTVKILNITGENVMRYYIDDDTISIYGDTPNVPDYEVVVAEGSSYSKETTEEEGYIQLLNVTGKNGYCKQYKVSYIYDENSLVGINSVSTKDGICFSTNGYKEEGNDYYILNLTSTMAELPDELDVRLINNKATYELTESDKEGYVKKLTVTYKEVTRVYYIVYTLQNSVWNVKSVTDGENVIFDYNQIQTDYENNEFVLAVEGKNASLSENFAVTMSQEGMEVVMAESDKEGYVKKLTVTYGAYTAVIYVSYEQKEDMPYIISVEDRDNPFFKATIKHHDAGIYISGVRPSVSDNLEIVVPEGMTYERNGSMITVSNANGTTRDYYMYYTCDLTAVMPLSVTDEGNTITKVNGDFDSGELYVYGYNNVLSENAVFVMPQGVEGVYDANNETLTVSVSGTDFTYTFYVYYRVDYSAVEILSITDANNEYTDESSIGSSYIYIYGKNSELGDTVEFKVPEGATVTVGEKDDYYPYYKVTVSNGVQSKEYTVYYYQSPEFFEVTNVTISGNAVPYTVYSNASYDNENGTYYGTIHVTGTMEKLTSGLEVEVADGLEASVSYMEESYYPASVTVKNGDVTFVYKVRYIIDYSSVVISDVKDVNNEYTDDTYINNTYIIIYGKNNELGNTVEFEVPEGAVVSEIRNEDKPYYYVTVTNGNLSREYRIEYRQSQEFFKVEKVTISGNEVPFETSDYSNYDARNGYYYGMMEVTGTVETLVEGLEVEVAEGLEASVCYDETNSSYPANITITNGDATFVYKVQYEVDYSSVVISQVSDVNNEYTDSTYFSDNYIYIYGKNNELGNTVEFTVPEGATVSVPTKEEGAYYYNVTVTNGSMSRDYYIRYIQDQSFFLIENVTISGNEVPYQVYSSTIEVTGKMETLTSGLEIEVGDGLEVSITYDETGSGYPASVTVINGEATYTYQVDYYVDYTSVTISAVRDANNEYTDDTYISGTYISIYGKNETLGDTVEFEVPEGTTVSEIEQSGTNRYQVTVSDGMLSRTYTISYQQVTE